MRVPAVFLILVGCADTWEPPSRFSGDYVGNLSVNTVNQKNVDVVCQMLLGVQGDYRGCAWADAESCIVFAADETYKGASTEAILRHEIGHCNGWPAHHPI